MRCALQRRVVGATHCVALMQLGDMREEGEAVPRPYRQLEHFRVLRNREGIPKQGDL